MSTHMDLPLFAYFSRGSRTTSSERAHGEAKAYVVQGQERPADLPKLRESAATMERLVLEWFAARTNPMGYATFTPSMCACGLGLELTTVRPRITQLSKRVAGPRLERCKWIPRRETKGSSEGWYRFTMETK